MRRLFVFLLVACWFQVYSQKIQQAVETLYSKYPQEKVIVCLSKNDYIAGETIFFKTYVLSGYQLSVISTNVYVQL